MSRNQSFVSLVCKVKVTKSCLKNTLSNFLEILFFSVPNVKSTRVNKATHKQSNMPREEMVVNTNVIRFQSVFNSCQFNPEHKLVNCTSSVQDLHLRIEQIVPKHYRQTNERTGKSTESPGLPWRSVPVSPDLLVLVWVSDQVSPGLPWLSVPVNPRPTVTCVGLGPSCACSCK